LGLVHFFGIGSLATLGGARDLPLGIE